VKYNDPTTIGFVVNQLSPSSIGMYPLVIIHPKPLPRLQVRSIYLMMTGSLGFGSNDLDFIVFTRVEALPKSLTY